MTVTSLVVAPGVYQETVSFNGKALSILSTVVTDPTAVAKTVIEGDDGGSGFHQWRRRQLRARRLHDPRRHAGHLLPGGVAGDLNCRILDNAEAGIKLWEGSNPVIVNCIIAGNGGDGIEMWAAKTGRLVTYNLRDDLALRYRR